VPARLAILILVLACTSPGIFAPAVVAADFDKEIKPLLNEFCFKCHGGTKKKGGIVLDTYGNADAAAKDPKVWEAVLENLRTGVMPPDDEEKQPTLEQRELLMKWVEAAVFHVDPDHPDPGRVTVRRLNRIEYNNTIRDLVGVKFDAGADFPADDSGYGFDNIGDVLSLPPVLFERYLAAAEKVMSAAILNDHTPRSQAMPVNLLTMQGGPDKGNTDNARRVDDREATAGFEAATPGQHTIRVDFQSGKAAGEGPKVEIKVDGQLLKTVSLSGERDKSDTYKLPVAIAKNGKHTVSFRVVNWLAQPEMKDGKPRNRVATIRKLDVMTPPQVPPAPESQIKLFTPGQRQPSLEAAARAVISTFATRAFRRPLLPQELARFMAIYAQAKKKGGNFEQSVQTALTAVLVSPNFLFRCEFQPEPDSPKSTHNISEYALASRLSYFMWSTMPDDELRNHAVGGTLRKNLDAQIKRMLRDPRARALTDNFAGQWLQTRNLSAAAPDPKTFPEWGPGLAAAMERETEMLFEHILKEDRPVTDLLGADYTFVNERLARLYDIAGVEGDAFVKVKVPAARPGGILGHGSFLTLTSNPTRTSPVKRGKFVLENILGTPPPPAPPDVPDLNDPKRGELKGTLRQRLELHRKDAICAGCHARMDPIGFALENFDGIGGWRDKDAGAAIESAGQLVSGEKFNNAVELRELLLNKKRGDFLRCVTEKMLTYALGRGVEYYDRPAIEKIVANMEKDGAKFSSLVTEIIKSVPFQMRRGEGDHREFAKAKKGTAAVKTEAPPATTDSATKPPAPSSSSTPPPGKLKPPIKKK
jgi:hypothetical protein